jgi:hypothetical protein
LNINAAPRPVGASTGSTKDVDISSAAGDSSLNVAHGQASNGDTIGGGSGRAAVLIVLLDDDTVLGDSGEGDVLVGDALDGAGGTIDGLDADTCDARMLDNGVVMVLVISLRTILGVLDVAVLDGDTVDGVVGASTDGADGDTVATSALSAGEVDILEGISRLSIKISR